MSAVPRPALVVRSLTPADLRAVMGIERRAYSHPWSQGVFRDCLRAGYACLGLERDGGLVGYGVMAVAAGEAHLLNLCIDPGHQQQGLGACLLDFLIGRAERLGADTIFLEVRVSNLAARRLYDRAGFNEIGLRKAYYPGVRVREDALVLGKYLGLGGAPAAS